MAKDGGFYGCVEDYVKERGGNRPIKKILVANNGIGAVKAIRSMRKWAYETFGNERAVQFVAMATPEDLRANAEYIRMADEVVDVPGGNNSNNYANVMLIVEIAERWRVDAVWAGWGHASENPLLPDTLAATARKIVFIGPSGPPMRALGDKIGSTIIAQSAGVPTIAWNGDGLRADYSDGGIPDDVYAKANVTTPAQAAEACERIGFPVMIKASEGGGGKGIRMVHESEGVAAAYRQVASEVAGSPIFVMRLAPRSRHLEVQLLADTYGEAIALNGRDCSVQRRHQKIIEEGPPVVTSPEVWRDMERSAVQLAKKVSYCNAGTVEYLYSMDDQDFFFLELNPRLQVEHPVTEMITNVNLPAAQLQVAMGLPLHMIPDIRRMYGRDPYGTDHIDFNSEERPPAKGHCIAVRITAENPDQGFQPTSGTIKELNFRSTPDVWGYFSVDSSGLVHEFADSQFGHLFARGGDRETARRHMTVALKELSIRGDIRTTVEYIGEVLQSEDFISNRIDTGWLDVRIAAAKDGSLLATRMRKVDSHLAVVAGAVILAHEDVEERTQTFLEMLGKGLLPPKELLVTSKAIDLIYEGVKYSLNCCQAGPRFFTVSTLKGGEGGNALVEAQCRPLADGGYLLVIAGKSQVVYANQEASGLRLSVNGNTCVFTKDYDPACLDTDVAGKLARRVVADGARVKQGDAYCEVEVMKMYMPLCVRESGVVRWHLSEGAALKPGDRLATLELDDPSAVTRAEVFQGVLSPALALDSASDGETSASSATADDAVAAAAGGGAGGDGGDSAGNVVGDGKPHIALRNAVETLEVVLSGYAVPEMQSLRAIGSMRTSLADDLLPYHELKEVLSVLSGRLDGGLAKKLQALAEQYKAECKCNGSDSGSGGGGGGGVAETAAPSPSPLFPAGKALSLLDAHASEVADDRDRAAFWMTASDLAKVLLQHVQGPAGRASAALLQLIREYLNVERSFAGVDMEDSLKALRKAHEGEEAIKVYDAFRSHAAIRRKNRLLLTLLDDIRQANAEAKAFLSKLSSTAGDGRSDGAPAPAPAPAAAAAAAAGNGDGAPAAPSAQPALDVGVSVDNIADGEASRALADTEAFLPVLAELSSLSNASYTPVAARSRQLLIEYKSPSLGERKAVFSAAVAEAVAAAAAGDAAARRSVMDTFVARGVPVRDLLVPVVSKAADEAEGRAALELYTRRIYRTHVVDDFSWHEQTAGAATAAATAGVVHRGAFTFQSQSTRRPSVGGAGAAGAGAGSFVDLQLLSNSVGYDGGGPAAGSHRKGGDSSGGSGSLSVEGEDWGVGRVPSDVSRWAGVGVVEKLEDLDAGLESILEVFPQFRGEAPSRAEGAVNALHIVLLSGPVGPQDVNGPDRARTSSFASEGAVAAAAAADAQAADDECSHALRAALLKHQEALARADVRRVSVLSPREEEPSESSSSILGVFTFRARGAELKEDGLFRHIEPSHAFHLDLPRLSNFAIRPANTSQLQGGNMHVYMATPKEAVGAGAGKLKAGGGTRYFARAASEVVGRGKRYFMEQMVLEALNGIDLALAEAEDACIRAGRKESLPPPSNNHIFVNAVAPDPEVTPQEVADHIGELMERFQGRIQRLGVTQLEVKILSGLGADAGGALAPIRVVASNPTGYAVRVETYAEVSEAGKRVFRTLKAGDAGGGRAGGAGAGGSANSGMSMKQGWDGREVGMPYPVSLPFEDKRLLAQARSDTLYCFDFLELLEAGVQEQWAAYAKDRPQVTSTPSMVLHSRELVVRHRDKAEGSWAASQLDDLELVEVDRAAGLNDVGMVAWMLTLRTPEYPEGRQLVLIANDITHQAGSFGTREDVVFLLASRLSREKGLPRIYIAANSGARIGMAESLKKRFKVAWADPSDPTLGYRYLYLNREDYEAMKARGAVACEEIVDEPSGETRFKILDVIGEEPDLGVENLQGSGRIAGETSAAYSDVFTLTLVLGRTVGIGAYLVRLGQRTIQKASAAPILLTGYQALNTLMGREVYTSNEQLGGAGVMGPNGISHQLVDSHIGAVGSALRWLSYVPRSRGSYLPVLDMAGVDDVDREVEFQPMKGVPCDPRHMIAGHDEGLDGSWTSGFFDKGSFTETLAGWAEAVVTGRARLGGIPVGIVATEGRMREKNCPADPADVSSHERIVQQAGGVWYPDSAHKTAQAIQDLNHEGLPLMVFANWRGFSGGQRDMFDEVLKYGALIVDALVEYKQPVFVYIPPHAELRGGAWVVVDSTVNANVMEMYAANGARGGVLEANGAASIKFRDRDLLKTAHRLDPVLRELDAKVAACTEEEDRRQVSGAMAERETRVIGVYRQVAVQFADLHDTPGRMEARGAVRKVVPWPESRSFFFWRLRRRLAEFDLRKQVSRADPSVDSLAASALLKEWFLSEAGGAATAAAAGGGGGGDGNTGLDWEEDKSVLAWMEDQAGSIKGHLEQLEFGRVSAQVSELAASSPEAVLEGLLSAAGGLSKSAREDLINKLSSSSSS